MLRELEQTQSLRFVARVESISRVRMKAHAIKITCQSCWKTQVIKQHDDTLRKPKCCVCGYCDTFGITVTEGTEICDVEFSRGDLKFTLEVTVDKLNGLVEGNKVLISGSTYIITESTSMKPNQLPIHIDVEMLEPID